MTLFLLMHNSYAYFLLPIITIITIIFKTFVQINHHSLFLFFQVIENDIKRRCSLTRWLMKILYETRWSKKKFDGGTLLDENRPVRRRNRGIDLLVDYESSKLSRWQPSSTSLNGPHCLKESGTRLFRLSCNNFTIFRPSVLSGHCIHLEESIKNESRLVYSLLIRKFWKIY